jgi:uncharacterized membrane protein YagU involved in acid resistance
MRQNFCLPFVILGCILILVGCFLPWTQDPTYNLFTIGDYAGSYGQYIDELRFVSVTAFSIPVAACFVLISQIHAKTSRIVGIILGSYCLLLSIAAGIVVMQAIDADYQKSSAGAAVVSIGAVFVLAGSIMNGDRSKMKKTTKENNG